jgi:hypothetical protein
MGSKLNEEKYINRKGIAINVAGNISVVLIRSYYQKHKEFDKNDFCYSDIAMWTYMAVLFVKQIV